MTENNLHKYNEWLTEVWSKQISIPFMIDAPSAFFRYNKEKCEKDRLDKLKKQNFFKRGTIKCCFCKTVLHFENYMGIRITYENMYNSYCPNCKKNYKVKV